MVSQRFQSRQERCGRQGDSVCSSSSSSASEKRRLRSKQVVGVADSKKEKRRDAVEIPRRRDGDRYTVPVKDADAAADMVAQNKVEVPVVAVGAVPERPDEKRSTVERKFDVRREIKPN